MCTSAVEVYIPQFLKRFTMINDMTMISIDADIIISFDADINDPLTMGQTHIVSGIFREASKALTNGRKVIVQRFYTNAPPETLCEFNSQSELSGWKERLNAGQITLGREQIV